MTEETPRHPAPPVKSGGLRFGFGLTILVLFFTLFALTGGSIYLHNRDISTLQSDLAKFGGGIYLYNRDINTLQSDLAKFIDLAQRADTDIRALDMELRTLQLALGTQTAALNGLKDRLAQQVHDAVQQHSLTGEYERFEEHWIVQQTGYLLRRAALRLQLETDIRGAVSDFEKAFETLSAFGGADLVDVRLAVGDDLAALQTVSLRNTLDHQRELDGLINRLAQLPNHPGWTKTTRADPTLVDKILSLVRFRTSGANPDIKALAHQHIGLALEQAQVGLLRRDAILYDRAMQRALHLLTTYFDTTQPVVSDVQSALIQLAELADNLPLPSVEKSLQLLETWRVNHSQNGNSAP